MNKIGKCVIHFIDQCINESCHNCAAGWAEISEFSLVLESTHPFSDPSQFVVLPLHSGIPSKDQRQVFLVPPTGVRKVILATNIGEKDKSAVC